jgi:hypothetical protein
MITTHGYELTYEHNGISQFPIFNGRPIFKKQYLLLKNNAMPCTPAIKFFSLLDSTCRYDGSSLRVDGHTNVKVVSNWS